MLISRCSQLDGPTIDIDRDFVQWSKDTKGRRQDIVAFDNEQTSHDEEMVIIVVHLQHQTPEDSQRAFRTIQLNLLINNFQHRKKQ